MVRKPVFTREEIIEAGLTVVAEEGLTQLTARRVADELGASTAPVYSNFANMEDLETAVKQSAVERLWKYSQEKYTENVFLNIGIGILNFSWDHPRLYVALFLDQVGHYNPGPDLVERITGVLAEMPELTPLHPVERMLLLKKMSIFTHGLATNICTGIANELPRDEVIDLMAEVGHAIVSDSFARGPRSAEEIARLSWVHLCGGAPQEPRPTPEEKDEENV